MVRKRETQTNYALDFENALFEKQWGELFFSPSPLPSLSPPLDRRSAQSELTSRARSKYTIIDIPCYKSRSTAYSSPSDAGGSTTPRTAVGPLSASSAILAALAIVSKLNFFPSPDHSDPSTIPSAYTLRSTIGSSTRFGVLRFAVTFKSGRAIASIGVSFAEGDAGVVVGGEGLARARTSGPSVSIMIWRFNGAS